MASYLIIALHVDNRYYRSVRGVQWRMAVFLVIYNNNNNNNK